MTRAESAKGPELPPFRPAAKVRNRSIPAAQSWSSERPESGAPGDPLPALLFDLWAVRWRRREANGDMVIVRYADDIVVGFEHEADGRRFLHMMRERLAKFALTLPPRRRGSPL